MNMKHYIQLIGFDGENFWRLCYVEIKDNEEVYYGLVSKNTQLSFSRHGSGEFHMKVGEKKITSDLVKYKVKPLSELKTMEFLATLGPTNGKEKLSEAEYRKYVSKKSNALFLIDLRNFDGTLNVQVAIVNPTYKDSITNNYKFEHECQVYIYTSSNPWVVFYILNVHTSSPKP